MSQTYRQRPSELVGIDDPYAAFCFDEAVYHFGVYVESELRRISQDAKTNKEAANARKNHLTNLLQDDALTGEVPQLGFQPHRSIEEHDPTDPVSAETAKRMPPAVKFTGQRFQDPAKYFKDKK